MTIQYATAELEFIEQTSEASYGIDMKKVRQRRAPLEGELASSRLITGLCSAKSQQEKPSSSRSIQKLSPISPFTRGNTTGLETLMPKSKLSLADRPLIRDESTSKKPGLPNEGHHNTL